MAESQALAFGKFVAGNGSVLIAPNGSRSTTGEVVALTMDPGQAAQLVVSGAADAGYSVTLPADGTVFLSNGTHQIPVNGFTSSPAPAGTLSAGGSEVLRVGATLGVSAGQVSGAYSGSYTVIVEYN